MSWSAMAEQATALSLPCPSTRRRRARSWRDRRPTTPTAPTLRRGRHTRWPGRGATPRSQLLVRRQLTNRSTAETSTTLPTIVPAKDDRAYRGRRRRVPGSCSLAVRSGLAEPSTSAWLSLALRDGRTPLDANIEASGLPESGGVVTDDGGVTDKGSRGSQADYL